LLLQSLDNPKRLFCLFRAPVNERARPYIHSGGVLVHAKHLAQHSERLDHMVGVFLTFRYGDDFDEQAVRKIADAARPRFKGMPELRSKAFTVDARKRVATNFYVWSSVESAKAFFTDALLERVTDLYGVRPSVDFVQIAALVENSQIDS
jgi:hypothetical protein